MASMSGYEAGKVLADSLLAGVAAAGSAKCGLVTSAGTPRRHVVLLGCGHWFREMGHPGGTDGEMRACAHPEHYPRQFEAVYLGNPDLSSLGPKWVDPA